MGEPPYLNLFLTHSVGMFFLGGGGGGGGGAFLPILCAHCLERTYFHPFSIIILIRALCIPFPWNLNVLYIIYHLMHIVL